jgi:hypothetical protein
VTNVVLASDRFRPSGRPTRLPGPVELEMHFRFLGTDVRVVSASVGLLQHWATVYGAFRVMPGEAAITVRVETRDGRRALDGDDRLLPPLATPPLDRWLWLRGVAVCRAGQATLLVGGPDAGGTPLALSLATRGQTLLAADLLPLDPADLLLAPFPRSVRLRRDELSLLAVEPAHPALTPFRTWSGAVEWQADTRLLLGQRPGRAAAEVAAIVFLEAAAGGEPRLSPLAADEAAHRLRAGLAQPPADGALAERALARLCRQAPAHVLVSGPPAATGELVDHLLQPPPHG